MTKTPQDMKSIATMMVLRLSKVWFVPLLYSSLHRLVAGASQNSSSSSISSIRCGELVEEERRILNATALIPKDSAGSIAFVDIPEGVEKLIITATVRSASGCIAPVVFFFDGHDEYEVGGGGQSENLSGGVRAASRGKVLQDSTFTKTTVLYASPTGTGPLKYGVERRSGFGCGDIEVDLEMIIECIGETEESLSSNAASSLSQETRRLQTTPSFFPSTAFPSTAMPFTPTQSPFPASSSPFTPDPAFGSAVLEEKTIFNETTFMSRWDSWAEYSDWVYPPENTQKAVYTVTLRASAGSLPAFLYIFNDGAYRVEANSTTATRDWGPANVDIRVSEESADSDGLMTRTVEIETAFWGDFLSFGLCRLGSAGGDITASVVVEVACGPAPTAYPTFSQGPTTAPSVSQAPTTTVLTVFDEIWRRSTSWAEYSNSVYVPQATEAVLYIVTARASVGTVPALLYLFNGGGYQVEANSSTARTVWGPSGVDVRVGEEFEGSDGLMTRTVEIETAFSTYWSTYLSFGLCRFGGGNIDISFTIIVTSDRSAGFPSPSAAPSVSQGPTSPPSESQGPTTSPSESLEPSATPSESSEPSMLPSPEPSVLPSIPPSTESPVDPTNPSIAEPLSLEVSAACDCSQSNGSGWNCRTACGGSAWQYCTYHWDSATCSNIDAATNQCECSQYNYDFFGCQEACSGAMWQYCTIYNGICKNVATGCKCYPHDKDWRGCRDACGGAPWQHCRFDSNGRRCSAIPVD